MRNTSLTIILTILCFGASNNAKADLGEYPGYAKTFLSAVEGFIGSTTVTPAYALLEWRRDITGYYHSGYYESHYYCSRNMYTSTYYYNTRIWLYGDTFSITHTSFDVTPLQRLNYNCNQDWYALDGTLIRDNMSVLANFKVAVWAHSIVKTGFFPPAQPYTGWLKTEGTLLQSTCDAVTPYVQPMSTSFLLRDTGWCIVQVGWVNYDDTYPMLCWMGEYGDYN
jgi:hypothetical protein